MAAKAKATKPAKTPTKAKAPAFSNPETASVAAAIQEGALHDHALRPETYFELQTRLRAYGFTETEEGHSFFADELDMEQLDEVVAGINE